MTADEILHVLAQNDWENAMKEVLKEAMLQFGVLKKNIADYQKEVKKMKKVAECEAKKVATAEAQALRAHGRGRGSRRGGRARGRG